MLGERLVTAVESHRIRVDHQPLVESVSFIQFLESNRCVMVFSEDGSQSLSPTQVQRLHEFMDAGSTEFERIADSDARICYEALLGTSEVLSNANEDHAGSKSANSRFGSPRFVGSGAFGIVFFVFDHMLGIDVAIKLLRPSRTSPIAQQRFLAEAQITANLTHPGIVRLYDSGMLGQIPYITSAIVLGGSLADWIAKYPSGMKPDVACKIILSIAEAVAFAHSKLTYHRDIKPSNILMTGDEINLAETRPVLTDFGLAKRWDKTEAALTLEGDIVGTARYMSPEQASGSLDDYSVGSEVFSLGIVLFELLTGCVPFVGKNSTEIRKAIIHDRPASLKQANPQLGSDLAAIVGKCLEKSPERRYESVAALGKDLQRYLNGQPVEASSPSLLRVAFWNAKQHPIVTSAVSLAILTITLSMVAVGYSWWKQSRLAKREHQTKIEYVMLFGKLVDDVISQQKDHHSAILNSLQGFQASLEKDLEDRPDDQDLSHLLSVVLHYKSNILVRLLKPEEAIRCRVDSVALLKKLRALYPENSKYRFQHLNGLVMTLASLAMVQDRSLKDYSLEKIGISREEQLLSTILAEIDSFLLTSPQAKYRDACNTFRMEVAKRLRGYKPAVADELVRITIQQAESLLGEYPEMTEYIGPAISAKWDLSNSALISSDYQRAADLANDAANYMERYFRLSNDKPWAQLLRSERGSFHVDVLYKANRLGDVIDVSSKCLAATEELASVPGLKLHVKSTLFRMRGYRYLCYSSLMQASDAERELDRLKEAAMDVLDNKECLQQCRNLCESLHLPDSISEVLTRGDDRE